MKLKSIIICACVAIMMTMCTVNTKDESQSDNDSQVQSEMNYSSGGFASIVIDRPADVVFKMLTDVNIWPQINLGVTMSITPENVVLEKGTKFNETIASPIPGIENWTNEWTVEDIETDKIYIMSGRENFSKAPIHSRITYQFTKLEDNKTLFKRTIEVTLDDKFTQNASPQEIEALYRFLGSQWEMTSRLKKYVEANSSN